jgi:ABC-2 type transport system permease protein
MILRRELQQNWKGFLICTLICVALSLYMIALLPSMGADIQQLIDVKFPAQLQKAFGMSNMDFKQPMNGYAILFSYFYLTYAIYAASLFSRIVAKEFADKTAEYLFSLPARRIDIILTKLGVAFGFLTASVAITLLVSWIAFAAMIPDHGPLLPLLTMNVASWIGALFFAALSLLLSAFYIKTRMAVGVVLVAYLLQIVISLKDEMHPLKYLSPFDWFKGSALIHDGLPISYTLVAVLATAGCLYGGISIFVRKDVLV